LIAGSFINLIHTSNVDCARAPVIEDFFAWAHAQFPGADGKIE
jgi:hypothetical protein